MASSGGDFFELIKTFAQLDLSAKPTEKGETCPVCQATGISLTDFAEHVYSCVKKLDLEEDEKLAERLTDDWCPGEESYAKTQQGKLLAGYAQPTVCADGVKCQRGDRKHFEMLYHPPAHCPMCEKEFPILELYNHMDGTCGSFASIFPSSSIPPTSSSLPSTSPEEEEKSTRGGRAPRLSRDQLIAMSASVVQQSQKVDESTIIDMLDAFGKLGFSREVLQEKL